MADPQILVVGGDSDTAAALSILKRQNPRIRSCPAPVDGTSECIDEWLRIAAEPRCAAVFRQGKGSDIAANRLIGHGVTVARFTDTQSMIRAVQGFGR